jgi:hypothetical protein
MSWVGAWLGPTVRIPANRTTGFQRSAGRFAWLVASLDTERGQHFCHLDLKHLIPGDVKPDPGALINDDADDHAGMQVAEVIAANA